MVIYISKQITFVHLQKNKKKTKNQQKKEPIENSNWKNYLQNVQTTKGMLRMKRKWEKYHLSQSTGGLTDPAVQGKQ